MRRRGIVAVLGAVSAWSGGSALAGLAPMYTLETFGLTDGNHTSTSGTSSNPMNLYLTTAPMPMLAGWANYYYPGISTFGTPGRTAWVHNSDGTLSTVGLYGSEFISTNTNRYSSPGGQTGTGVSGTSYIYSGGTQSGQAAWYYNGTQTVEIGLIGGNYLSGTSRNSSASATVGSPLVSGTSQRSTGSSQSKGAWVYNPSTGTTTQVGYYDSIHNGAGLYSSNVNYRAGQYAVGYSERYNGGATSLGRSAWLYNATSGTQTRVGLTGGIYTSGARENTTVAGVNAQGRVIGYSSANYDSTASAWQSTIAWTRSPAGVTTNLGLSGSQYVSPLGYRGDMASYVNASGQVAGSTGVWSSAAGYFDGGDAWVYSGGTYQVIPVPVADYTTGFNTFRMLPQGMNDDGVVAGFTQRKNASGTSMGPMPWVYMNGISYPTGIYDAAHQSSTGRTQQSIRSVGQTVTVGEAYKFTSTNSFGGYDAWVFDHQTHVTTPLSLSNYGDAEGSTTAAFVTPDGWVGGFYDYWLGGNTSRWQGFLWSAQTGVVDFDALLPGGLAGQDIAYVNWVSWVTPEGDIYATVTKTDGSTTAAIFAGAVPEPGVVMLASGVSLLALQRRSRKRIDD